MIHVWNIESGEPAPDIWDRWLKDGETLLWAAKVPDAARRPEYRRAAVVTTGVVILFLPFVPMTGIDEFCAAHVTRECERLWYLRTFGPVVLTPEALRQLWRWKRRRSATDVLHYAITDRRVLTLGADVTRLPASLNIAGLRAAPGFFGDTVEFGSFGRPRMSFAGLGDAAVQKALVVAGRAGARV